MVKNPVYWGTFTLICDVALQVSGFQNTYVGIGLLLIAIAMLFYGVRDWLRFPPIFRTTWLASLKAISFGSKIQLNKAARIAYEEARASGSVWAHAAERLSGRGRIGPGSPDDILNYLATYIAGKVQIYGERPPSTRPEAIDRTRAPQGRFVGGAIELHFDDDNSVFMNLKVSKKDFLEIVAAIKSGLKTNTQI